MLPNQTCPACQHTYSSEETEEATPVKVVQERREYIHGVIIGGVIVGVLATVFVFYLNCC